MNRRRAAKLDDTCLTIEWDREELTVIPECFSWMRDAGYPVEGITAVHNSVSVKDGKENTGYLVIEIETLRKPVDEADAVADKIDLLVCTCPGFHYSHFADLDAEPITNTGNCPHTLALEQEMVA